MGAMVKNPHIDVTISTQSTWQDILLYYFLSLVILFFLFIIKIIIEKRINYVLSVFLIIYNSNVWNCSIVYF